MRLHIDWCAAKLRNKSEVRIEQYAHEDAVERENAKNLQRKFLCLLLLGQLLFPDRGVHIIIKVINSLLRDVIRKPTFYV